MDDLRIISAVPLSEHRIKLLYEKDGERIFDVNPYIFGRWYGELANLAYFSAVQVTEDGTGVFWPHGQDIAPHELYELSEPVNMMEV